jgi:hypothetical protein
MGVWSISGDKQINAGATGLAAATDIDGGYVNGGNYAGQAGLTLSGYGKEKQGYGSVLASGDGDGVSPNPATTTYAFDQGDGSLFLLPSVLDRRTRASIGYVWDGQAMNDSVRAVSTGVRTQMVKTAIRTNKWDSFSAAWDSGYPANNQSGLWGQEANANQIDGTQVDDEANVSRANQGEFVYQIGSNVVASGAYEAKTG